MMCGQRQSANLVPSSAAWNCLPHALKFLQTFTNHVICPVLSPLVTDAWWQVTRPVHLQQSFQSLTIKQRNNLLTNTPAKHSVFDSVLTQLVKQAAGVLAAVLCHLCNALLQKSIQLTSLKQPIVWPRLMKLTLDPDRLTSHRPVSNLSFITNLIGHVAAEQFVRHAELKGQCFWFNSQRPVGFIRQRQLFCQFTTSSWP